MTNGTHNPSSHPGGHDTPGAGRSGGDSTYAGTKYPLAKMDIDKQKYLEQRFGSAAAWMLDKYPPAELINGASYGTSWNGDAGSQPNCTSSTFHVAGREAIGVSYPGPGYVPPTDLKAVADEFEKWITDTRNQGGKHSKVRK